MKVVCPYTDLHPETEKALGDKVDFVDVSESKEGYFWLLYSLWHRGESFIVVEHDHLPWPWVTEELTNCSAAVCAYDAQISTYHSGEPMYAPAILKYSDSLIRRLPDHMENSTPQDRQWTNCAEWVYRRLPPLHIHTPPIKHLNSLRMEMTWDQYVTYRYVNGPVEARKGRGPGEPCITCEDK